MKELLYTFFKGEMSLDDEKLIRKWTEESSDNYQTFLNERKLFDAMLLLADENRFSSQKTKKYFNKLFIHELGKIAAVIAITLMVTFICKHYTDNSSEMLAMQKITVPAGQRISIELSDGTLVWLNSRTSIQYPAVFSGKERRIKIDGEVYCEVTHDKYKPFIIETPRGDVEVLGTKFYLEAYSDNDAFVASLMEGSVKVTSNGQQLTLKPDQMSYLQNGKLKMDKIEDYNIYRWREGLICFKDKSFPDIMDKFEKYYGVVIEIENQNVLNYSCSGKFRQSDGILYALRVLQKDISFDFKRDEDNHIIHIK